MSTKKSTTASDSKVKDQNPLSDQTPKAEELATVKDQKKPKTEKKPAEKKEPKITKKSVVIEMISTKKGALVEDIAKQIVERKLDADYEKNLRVVKLWLSKIGFKVERDEKTKCYRKAS